MHQGSKSAAAAVREILSKQITSICLHRYMREYNCLGLLIRIETTHTLYC